MSGNDYDVIVIGGGPGGLKAAEEAARHGKRVLMLESEPKIGGACVRMGTIPSKSLRETALSMRAFQRRTGNVFDCGATEDLKVASLMTRLHQVIDAHDVFLRRRLDLDGVEYRHGRGRFVGPSTIEILQVGGAREQVSAPTIIVASGSSPRTPPGMPIDHTHILDSDSILSMTYLPSSLTVLGGGVIAVEYASTFACLGVKVTMIDKYDQPVGFMDSELTQTFVECFEAAGNRWLGGRKVEGVHWDGACSTVTTLEDGERVLGEKCLVALGREPNSSRLNLSAVGVETSARGEIVADSNCCTSTPGIYAVGDVIGPPSLAATSLEQGRRAVRHALGMPVAEEFACIPVGVYTIPEMASVGLDEAKAKADHGEDAIVVGRSHFTELARGQIAAMENGLLKLVVSRADQRILGVQTLGEGASELVSLGQLAIEAGLPVSTFVESIFNFPTLAEAYREAALDALRQITTHPEPALT